MKGKYAGLSLYKNKPYLVKIKKHFAVLLVVQVGPMPGLLPGIGSHCLGRSAGKCFLGDLHRRMAGFENGIHLPKGNG